MPLAFAAGPLDTTGERTSARARSSREYSEGELVTVATGRNQAEADFVANLLLEEGVPSLVRRSRGFDVPDMLAAGPRDVLVPRSGEQAAREILLQAGLHDSGGATGPGARAAARRPAARRSLVVGLIVWLGLAAELSSGSGEARQVRAPGALRVHERAAAERALERAPDVAGRLDREPTAAASPSSRASRSSTDPPSSCASRIPGGNDGSPPSRRRRAIAGRACAVCPENHCPAPAASHANRA